jgi:hypothetical protein
MRGRERVRGGEPRAHIGRSRRPSFSPAERKVRGGWDFGRVPQTGREGDDWIVVRRRSRRARRQAKTGLDRRLQEERSRYGGVASPNRHIYSPSREHRAISVDRIHWLSRHDRGFSFPAESRATCRQQLGLGTGQARSGFDRPAPGLRIFFRPKPGLRPIMCYFFSAWPVPV